MEQLGNLKLQLLTLLVSLIILTACGGGGSGISTGGGSSSVDSPKQASEVPSIIFPAPTRQKSNNIGIGPAFAVDGERPLATNLSNQVSYDDFEISYGYWRDASGRDGSATKADIIRYLQAIQSQEVRDAINQGNLPANVVSIPTGITNRSLRISSSASHDERQIIQRIIREINATLPWEYQVELGSDFAGNIVPENIPGGEIYNPVYQGQGHLAPKRYERGLRRKCIGYWWHKHSVWRLFPHRCKCHSEWCRIILSRFVTTCSLARNPPCHGHSCTC